MGNPHGFLKFDREEPGKQPADERVKHYKEFYKDEEFAEQINGQAARCMDCGTPFCHNGCPLGNIIPEFNDAVYKENWAEAFDILSSTNNFPEFTGRICPAPCEGSCVLGINALPVTIHNIERFIIEEAFKNGWVKNKNSVPRTGKSVAVIGSGPAGLAAADQLNSAGHNVTVFERDNAIGGLLRYGIPDFKLDKSIIDRRLSVMTEAGVEFKINANIGKDISIDSIKSEFDAIVLAIGSTVPRDLPVPGRNLKGVYFAMEYLKQNSQRVQGKEYEGEEILSTDKNVVVIGGGDTGSDCVGTSNRHGASNVKQFELMPEPPVQRASNNPWPQYPRVKKFTTSHQEGVEQFYSIMTKEFIGDNEGNLKAVKTIDVQWTDGKPVEVTGSEKEIPCERAFLAMGFLHPQHDGLCDTLAVDYDERGNVKTFTNFKTTSGDNVFTCGDAHIGQSLVVTAISQGRECAVAVDEFLQARPSQLEQKANTNLFA
ncbi:MAG: glutamate synthase subunit beta [Fibrobacterales bacterium]